MGLFGGLFNKEPQEVKDFWKAFNDLLKKGNQKNFDALAQASAACPDIWQGPFLLGLIMDTHSDLAYDEQKANEYHYMAKKIAAKGTDGEWVDTFYEFYETSAINSKFPELFNRETLAGRRLGVAALNCYTNMEPVVYGHEKNDDAYFWTKLLCNNTADPGQVGPFITVFSDWESYKGGKGDREWMRSLTNDFVKEGNKITELRNKVLKKDEKGKEVSEYDRKKTKSMHHFAMACCLIYAGPYTFDEWSYSKECGSEFNAGVEKLIQECYHGCVASMHMLTQLYFNDDQEIAAMTKRACNRSRTTFTEDRLFNCLLAGGKAGDAECANLLQKYFVKE